MECVKFILKNGCYYRTALPVSERMMDIGRILSLDAGPSDGSRIKGYFENTFSGKEDGFATNISDIERIDDNHVKLRLLYITPEAYNTTGTIIDKEQLYYLLDEWIRLASERVNAITVTYDNGIYTMEGK